MTDNLEIWNKLRRPPADALKEIKGGRLSGMTDINPQWRFEIMTETFGPVSQGWKYVIDSIEYRDVGTDGEVACFARVSVYIASEAEGRWADPIPGVGGSMLVAREKGGLHISDDAPKKAVTDALSVAFKALGIAADVYRGQMDSKYARKKTHPDGWVPLPLPGHPEGAIPAPLPGTIGPDGAKALWAGWNRGVQHRDPLKELIRGVLLSFDLESTSDIPLDMLEEIKQAVAAEIKVAKETQEGATP